MYSLLGLLNLAVRQYRTYCAERFDSALNVFVPDGFEASRIEDIAAEAGRSRGAFLC
jgi:hypothetical protein